MHSNNFRGSVRHAVIRYAIVASLTFTFAILAHTQTVKLDDNWQILVDNNGTLSQQDLKLAKDWRNVRVGLSWNAQFADMRDYMGVAWYRTNFTLSEAQIHRKVLLRFGAVDYFSQLYVNGRKVGEHEGGYTPFTFDISGFVHSGSNEIDLRVIDPPMDQSKTHADYPNMMYNEIPHGKQNWYVQTGGIWQGVSIELKPQEYVTGVHVTAGTDGSVEVRVRANGIFGPVPPLIAVPNQKPPLIFPAKILNGIKVAVIDPSGQRTELRHASTGEILNEGFADYKGKLVSPQLWSPDSPILYTVDVTLGDDHYSDRFGFRKFEAFDRRLYLNGHPFYMIAALDQDFYPDTIYTAPSKDYVKQQMRVGSPGTELEFAL